MTIFIIIFIVGCFLIFVGTKLDKYARKRIASNPKYSTEKSKTAGTIISLVIALVIFGILLLAVNSLYSSPSSTNTALTPGAPTTWYYVTPDLKCVQVPQQYSNEDSCQNAIGLYCFVADPTCNNANQTATLYYINSTNQCVAAPGNPYSVVLKSGNITAGVLAEESNCQTALGQACYNDSTCGGAGSPGMITINGVSYKLVTAGELIANASDGGFVDATGSVSLVAVQGTITHVYQQKNKTDYTLVINTGSGSLIFGVGTIDINTKASNGVNMSNYPVGTKVSAGGIFIGSGLNLQNMSSFAPSLGNIGLPTDTPVITNAAGGLKIMN